MTVPHWGSTAYADSVRQKADEFKRRDQEREQLRAATAVEREFAKIDAAAKALLAARRGRGVNLPPWIDASDAEKERNRHDAKAVLDFARANGGLT